MRSMRLREDLDRLVHDLLPSCGSFTPRTGFLFSVSGICRRRTELLVKKFHQLGQRGIRFLTWKVCDDGNAEVSIGVDQNGSEVHAVRSAMGEQRSC